jgi:hypothetical protein
MAHQTITNGPSKFDLMAALFIAAGEKQQNVRFNIAETGQLLEVRILQVGREDGSGESWLFQGLAEDTQLKRGRYVKGYFSTRTRRGTIEYMPALTL